MNVVVPPLSVPVPSVVAPSRKVTVPVAVLGVTVAVSVTLCPKTDGFTLDETAVVVEAEFTTWVSVDEVLAEKLPSPP